MHRGKEYGKKAFLSSYSIKGYDKTFEVWQRTGEKLDYKIFRFEVSVKDMRHLTKRSKPISIQFAIDLLDKSNLSKLANDLYMKSKAIKNETRIDLGNLPNPTKDIPIIAVMSNEETRQALKRESSLSTYKRFQSRYKRLIQNSRREEGEPLEQAIREKCEKLKSPISRLVL